MPERKIKAAPEPDQAPPEPSPEYLALSPPDREMLDQLVSNMQDLQNDVDRSIAVMGGPIYFIGGIMIQHELQVRTLRAEIEALRQRLSEIEDRVS